MRQGATGGGATALSYEDPRPFIAFPPALPERRSTVAVRLLLAVPLLVYRLFIAAAAMVAFVFGWCIALVTGRVPEPIAELLTGYVDFTLRVGAYLTLLSDEYPAFTLHPAPTPDGFAFVVNPAPLARGAVALRPLLAVPAVALSLVASLGLRLVSIASWVLTLVLGRLPVALHSASCVVLRYRARVGAYVLLLTSSYPRELFGDTEPQASGYGLPSASGDLIVLSAGERTLVGLCIVLGIYVAFHPGRPVSWAVPFLP